RTHRRCRLLAPAATPRHQVEPACDEGCHRQDHYCVFSWHAVEGLPSRLSRHWYQFEKSVVQKYATGVRIPPYPMAYPMPPFSITSRPDATPGTVTSASSECAPDPIVSPVTTWSTRRRPSGMSRRLGSGASPALVSIWS